MVLVRILKRRDAASLVFGVATGLILVQFVTSVSGPLSAFLSGLESEGSFRTNYWHPFVTFVVQIVVLELVARLILAVREMVINNRPR